MARTPGPSVRLKLALSYAGFLMLASLLLLGVVWVFMLRRIPVGNFVPQLADLPRVFNPSNFGPIVLGPATVLALLFLLIFGLLGGWLLAGRMLAPLDRLTEATRLAAAGSLSHRIALEGRGDEFRDLADSFDAMLARLEAHVAQQQRFAANASHELRTPLATTKALLEVARDDPGRDADQLIARLQAVNSRAIDLTEALLLLSRADQRAFARERVDLSLMVEEAVESLLPLAEARGVSIEITGEAASVLGSPSLLLQMTTNLLHNAIAHNRPSGGWVRLSLAAETGAAVLTVENSGEPLTPDLVATLTEPFRRGAERIAGHQAGVGLGLAIVDSIVRAHEGTLSLAPRREGGLVVAARLCTA